MKVSDMFPNKYWKASDCPTDGISLEIEDLVFEEVMSDGEKREKPALKFKGVKKLLILNQTNADALEDAFGDSDNWKGNRVTLRTERCKYLGKVTMGIRVSCEDFADDVPV